MKNKRFVSGILYAVGSVLFVASILILTGKIALAGTQNYAETYSISKWRNIIAAREGLTGPWHRDVAVIDTKNMTLGPAEWAIAGSSGDSNPTCSAGEQCFSETWTASSWSEGPDQILLSTDPNWGPLNMNFTFSTSPTLNPTTSVVFSTMGQPSDNTTNDLRLVGSGLYGATYFQDERPKTENFVSTVDVQGIHSWPLGWVVTGTVTTP